MNRERAEELLGDYVQGHLHDEELRSVEAALAGSAELRELLEGVRALYAVPGPDLPAAPSEPRFLERALELQRQEDAFAPRARSFFQQVRRLRWAATVLVAVLALFIIVVVWNGAGDGNPPAVEYDALRLLEVTLDVPPLPAEWPEERWFMDRATAIEAGRLTGRPVALVYTVRGCPRCAAFERSLEAEGTPGTLSGFVRARVPLLLTDPPELGSPWSAQQTFLHCPAVVVRRGDLRTETVWELTSAKELGQAARRWKALEQASGAAGPALTQEAFTECLGLLRTIPEAAAQHRFAEAAAGLRKIETRIPDADHPLRQAARTLQKGLDAALGRELERIRDLAGGDTTRRAQARDLARRLAPRAVGLEAHDELLRLAR